MPESPVLEVTITHNLPNKEEVRRLFADRLIANDWPRTDPRMDKRRAKTDLKLFDEMKTKGAAVIAAYKGATEKPSDRLVGWVDAGSEYIKADGLLCLKLVKHKLVDSSHSFLGNLAPHSCTIQTCHNRARGLLANLVLGKKTPRSIWLLHHRDVELLVTNYLFSERLCTSVWSGGRAFENIDHAGYSPAGRVVLAQTTVSVEHVGKKALKLLELEAPGRDLMMFGPKEAGKQCHGEIRYHSIEDVFAKMDAKREGRWLISRMLGEYSP